jgi:hypothetical protein
MLSLKSRNVKTPSSYREKTTAKLGKKCGYIGGSIDIKALEESRNRCP